MNDMSIYVDVDEDEENIGYYLERIYESKMQKSGAVPIKRKEPKAEPKQDDNIADELRDLKIQLQDELASVKNEIQICKGYIDQQLMSNSMDKENTYGLRDRNDNATRCSL